MDFSNLLKTASAFHEARVLLTGVELDLFTLLADKEMDLKQVCDLLNSDRRATQYVLDALASMELLEKREGNIRHLQR
jgi:hypothetical protein